DPVSRPPGESRGPQDPRDLPVPRSPGAPRHRAGTRKVHRVREGSRGGVRARDGPEAVGVVARLFPDPRRRPHGLVVQRSPRFGFATVRWTTFAWEPNPLLSRYRSVSTTAHTIP